MHSKYRLPLVLIATAALFAGTCRAEDDDEDEDDFGTFGFLAASPRSINVTMKVTQGAQVKFGNLGSVPSGINNANGSRIGHAYHDGGVAIDSPRTFDQGLGAELDANNNYMYDGAARYKVYATPGDAASGLRGDYLSWNPERTRSWRYKNESQAVELNGTQYIAFHEYSAVAQGNGFSSTRAINGGFEIGLSHALTNPTKRFSLSLTASIGLAGIYNNKSGKVLSTLVTSTDLYRYFPVSGTGAPADTPSKDSSGNDIPLTYRYTAPGNLLPVNSSTAFIEDTTALSQNPDLHLADEKDDDEAEVEGNWRVKGAYFTIKLGPQLNAMLTRSIGLNAGVGFAGTYASTRYSALESFKVAGLDNEIAYAPAETTKSILLAGYYANIDATWTLNDRTGIFAGFSYEQLGEYNQKLESRSAKIDLSATAGIRGGMSIKF